MKIKPGKHVLEIQKVIRVVSTPNLGDVVTSWMVKWV